MIKDEQKVLDFIEMTENLIKKKTEPKAIRETIRLYTKALEKVNLKTIRHKLEKEGFIFKDGLLQNGDRQQELCQYYSSVYNEDNKEYLMINFNFINEILDTYMTCIDKVIKFKDVIINWCDDTYNQLISGGYSDSIAYNIKYIGHIKIDIEDVYNKYVLDVTFTEEESSMINKVKGNDRKRVEKYIKGKHLSEDNNILKIEMDDIVILNNTICEITPCIIVDDKYVEDNNGRKILHINFNGNKYTKYTLQPARGFSEIDIETNVFDTLEDLYNSVISLGGKVCRPSGSGFIEKK